MSTPRNKFEVKLWNSLRHTGRAKYEPEKLPYILECEYLPDFTLDKKKSPGKIYIEGKGEFDAGARRKMIAVKKQHPDKDIRIVFYNAHGRIRKGSDTTCAQWADKNGYVWAHKTIPRKWFYE